MKRIYLIFTIGLLSLFAKEVSAQTPYNQLIFFAPDSSDDIIACPNSQVTVGTSTVSTGYVPNDVATININWGDGNTSTNPVTFLQSSWYTPNSFSHVYASNGIYEAIFSFSDTYGQTNVDTVFINVTNNCGSIYTNVLLDTDGNGQGDIWQPTAVIDITGANNVTQSVPLYSQSSSGQNFTGITGLDVTQSPYTLSVNPSWLASSGFVMSPSSPTSAVVTISAAAPVNDTPPFVVICDPNAPVSQTDLAVTYLYGWGFRAGQQTGFLQVNVVNLSCSGSENADLDIQFESLLSVFSHNIPGATVTGNVLHANINVNGSQTYIIYFDVPGPTPALTPLNFQADIAATATTDSDLTNNSATFVSEVRNSWDPNDKSVNKAVTLSPGEQEELVYTIRFQNMGNDDAYNIVVKDTMDSDLDLATFTLMEASHNVLVSIDPVTRIVTFNFPNIYLPAASVNEPASHGTVAYKIKENPGLGFGTEITNTAYIYFDFNPPIITNTTYNINDLFSIDEIVAADLTAHPVPASDYLLIGSKQNQPIESVKLLDITGKVVLNITNVGSNYTLDLQGISSGAYNLVLESQGAVVNKKIMIKK